MKNPPLDPCTCVVNGVITPCLRHDTLPMTPLGVYDPYSAPKRVIQATAHLTATKTASAAPFSGPTGDLIALTHHIDTQPTTEQWQTIKRLILSLERT